MNKIKIIFNLCLIVIFLFSFAFAEQIKRSASNLKEKETEKTSDLSVPNNPSEISHTVGAEKIQPQQMTSFPKSALRQVQGGEQSRTANYILVTDVLDGFGGQKYDGGCKLSFFAGGQSSPIGAGSSNHFNLYAGFVYIPEVVKHGDATGDGAIDVGDVVYLINYLFKDGCALDPLLSGDATCDGNVDVGDVVYLINYLFKGGPAPAC